MNRFCKVFGHNFQPRYDTSEARVPPNLNSMKGNIPAMFEKFRAITYVRDVCERCGETIERTMP